MDDCCSCHIVSPCPYCLSAHEREQADSDEQEMIRLDATIESLRADAALVEWYFGQHEYEVSRIIENQFILIEISTSGAIWQGGSDWPSAIDAIRKAKELSDG